MTTEKKARLRIMPGQYRGKIGFHISGRDAHGRSVRIFTESRSSAEHIRERVRDGLEIRVQDFKEQPTMHKGIAYFPNFPSAEAVADTLRAEHPACRVVHYERGWAVQYEKSGAYYPELSAPDPWTCSKCASTRVARCGWRNGPLVYRCTDCGAEWPVQP